MHSCRSLLIVNKKLVNYIFNDVVVYIIDYLFSNMKTISEKTGAKDSATNIRGRAQGS